MTPFALALTIVAVLVAGAAHVRFGRRAAVFALVALGMQGCLAAGTYRLAGAASPGIWVLQATVWLYILGLFAGVRVPGWRELVSWPASFFLAATFLALPWAVADGAAYAWMPFALAGAGFVRSFLPRRETVTLDLRVPTPPALARFPAMARRERGHPKGRGEHLRVVQISDPHLGPFMSEARLRAICERAVAAEPDLILLTGDYFTAETRHDAALLGRALQPLLRHPHVFACRGNHDLEDPEAVAEGLAMAGVTLLVDQSITAKTRLGPVQIVGMDFTWGDRGKRMRGVLTDVRRPENGLRIVLLHDPGAFRHLPAGSADLVLSGHTHGGHVGLVSLGLPWTFVGLVARMPDHGPWGHAGNRLYVHRAHGHYGFPIRLGVPPEESVIEIVR